MSELVTAKAMSFSEWVSVTPDRVLLLGLLILAIWFLWRRTEKQSARLESLHKDATENGKQMAVVVERNSTLFGQVMETMKEVKRKE